MDQLFREDHSVERVFREVDGIVRLVAAANTRPGALAGSIAHLVRDRGVVEVAAIGERANLVTAKALAYAVNMVAQNGLELVVVPRVEEPVRALPDGTDGGFSVSLVYRAMV